ncbi:MAG: alginate lyase family protein [Candidatus Sulfotelmatobacter sp.]
MDYGTEIDWHLDRAHNKRAPSKPWFKIHYLDFAEVGDSKITWELNRHQHWVTLAKAYRLNGDQRFVNEIFSQWKHWHRANPYPIGINWASSLEVAFRSLSWLWVWYLLGGSPVQPQGLRTEWVCALGVNARHIEAHLSTYFSPNTHLLGEAVALFFVGTLCPELPEAKRWAQRGWQIVLQAAEQQIRSDGLHFEQSTYYHVYALDFFLHARILASLNHIPVPTEFDRALEKMLDALCVLSRAGNPPQLGDDDGGRVFDPRRNRTEHTLDPLATGAVLFRRGDFKRVADGFREEAIWLLGEQGAAEFDRIPPEEPEKHSFAFESSGLYAMYNREGKEQLVVDAGPQGVMSSGHGHADALSVTVNAGGRPLLIDPGSFVYVGRKSERNTFRGTGGHNTLQVDGLDQAEPNGPFGWGKLPDVKAEKWIIGRHFDLFVGSHDGYCRSGSKIIHRRHVFSLKSKFWLVRDIVLGAGEHRLDLSWHLAPGLSMRDSSSNTFVEDAGRGLRIFTVDGHVWSQQLEQGWCAPAYGRKKTASVLRFSTVTKLPAEFVTLLSTSTRTDRDNTVPHLRQVSMQDDMRAYQFETADEVHSIFFAGGGQPWRCRVWTSDAEFLYISEDRDEAIQALTLCQGSFAKLSGQSVISSPTPIERCELKVEGQQIDMFSSDSGVRVNTDGFGLLQTDPDRVLTNALPDSGRGKS